MPTADTTSCAVQPDQHLSNVTPSGVSVTASEGLRSLCAGHSAVHLSRPCRFTRSRRAMRACALTLTPFEVRTGRVLRCQERHSEFVDFLCEPVPQPADNLVEDDLRSVQIDAVRHDREPHTPCGES